MPNDTFPNQATPGEPPERRERGSAEEAREMADEQLRELESMAAEVPAIGYLVSAIDWDDDDRLALTVSRMAQAIPRLVAEIRRARADVAAAERRGAAEEREVAAERAFAVVQAIDGQSYTTLQKAASVAASIRARPTGEGE